VARKAGSNPGETANQGRNPATNGRIQEAENPAGSKAAARGKAAARHALAAEVRKTKKPQRTAAHEVKIRVKPLLRNR